MKRIVIDFWVGIFVLIGIACITFLSFKIASKSDLGFNKKDTYILYASFYNIGSLKINAPVKVSGLTIGRVINIQLDSKTYQAIVTMQIIDDYKFSTDSSAQILTIGLLGEQYVGLQSGADNSYLGDGGQITITSSALVLENLIGKFLTNVTNK